jgi:flagellum-specific ATP synthase
MQGRTLSTLAAELRAIRPGRAVGRIVQAGNGLVRVSGLAEAAGLGDRVRLAARAGAIGGEIVDLTEAGAGILPEGSGEGVRVGDPVLHLGPGEIAPDDNWIGRVIDADGRAADGRRLARGATPRPLRAAPPPAATRRRLGSRIATGLAAFDTLLPLVRGQRIGLFAAAGVGKSRLLGALGRGLEADVTVIALIGERGRELRDFVEEVLGPEGLARSVVVVATSDQPPLVRRRALWTAMAVAEHFRDAGRHVLFLADSVTRFAEAHREVALASGESGALRGYPPSVAHTIMALAERAGPGAETSGGDITAVFTVLVPGADMDEPVADILRGVLDGHVVLDRAIAERGRFPAIDALRSVSRSLPGCASSEENALISLARSRLAAYDEAALMIQSGLYTAGADAATDAAVACWPALDGFLAETAPDGIGGAFARLAACLGKPAPGNGAVGGPAAGA